MVRQVIVVGDTLAPHDCTVTTGSSTDAIDGKAIRSNAKGTRA